MFRFFKIHYNLCCDCRHDDLKAMLDSSKDNLKLDAMKRIVGVGWHLELVLVILSFIFVFSTNQGHLSWNWTICSFPYHTSQARMTPSHTLQYLFLLRSARLTVLLIIYIPVVWQIKLILINALNKSLRLLILRSLSSKLEVIYWLDILLVSSGSRRAISHLFVMLSFWTSKKASRIHEILSPGQP